MHKYNISLNGLRMFEAAARHLSFTKAAEELHVTQAAVSQQIRRLEDQLGMPLFQRKTRGLSLTPSGRDLAQTTRTAINNIQDTIDRITNTDTQGVLAISTLASFASRWLIPRLSGFQKEYENIELHVHTSTEKVDFTRGGIDAAIRLDAVNEPGLNAELLMLDALCLVGTPTLAETLGDDIASLYEHTIIVDEVRALNSPTKDLTGVATEEALSSLGLDRSRLDMTMYNQSDNVVLGALAGQGFAFTRLSLCIDDLEHRRLQIIYNYCNPLSYGYSLVYPHNRTHDARLIAFKRWLHEEANMFRHRLSQYLPD